MEVHLKQKGYSMHILENSAEIRLFLVGWALAPLEGADGALAYSSVPFYALLRVGEITTPSGHEYALGLQRSPWLQPTYIVHMPHLWVEYEDVVREVCTRRVEIRKLSGMFSCRSSFERCLETGGDGKQQRVVVLIPLDTIKEINIPARDGFGVFLGLEELKQLVKNEQNETVGQNDTLKSKGVLKLTMPAVSVSALGLNIAFKADPDDLSFLIRAMEQWDNWSRDKRVESWEKSQQWTVGTLV